jgi:hypothetical protein
MDDVAPELLEAIRRDFNEAYTNSRKIALILEKVNAGTATYAEANEYAVELGEILASVYKHNITSDILPDGQLYYNIAKRIIEPTMNDNYNLIANTSMQVQKSLNEAAGIGINAIRPELNSDRIDGIINRISSELFENVKWLLDEPVKNFSQSVVDDSIKVNSEFHGKSGLTPRIVRKLSGGCCEWCARLAGKYTYPDVPPDVYRRHQRCRCTVDYDPGSGKVQNVHSKQWKTKDESDKIHSREKELGNEKTTPIEREKKMEDKTGFAYQIFTHPALLQAYTPGGLKRALENAGYIVMPLGQGSLKGKTFEEGGGFRTVFGGDKYIQYHPAANSHHGGEYYKMSDSIKGKRRYNMEGSEIDDRD